jgi:hypothetical protein
VGGWAGLCGSDGRKGVVCCGPCLEPFFSLPF